MEQVKWFDGNSLWFSHQHCEKFLRIISRYTRNFVLLALHVLLSHGLLHVIHRQREQCANIWLSNVWLRFLAFVHLIRSLCLLTESHVVISFMPKRISCIILYIFKLLHIKLYAWGESRELTYLCFIVFQFNFPDYSSTIELDIVVMATWQYK